MFLIIDTGCSNPGFYGNNCETPCPKSCKDNTCHIQNGTCFSCKPGWTGEYCDTSKMINLILFTILNVRFIYDSYFQFHCM